MTNPARHDSLADLLAWQHGVLSRAQAHEHGLSDSALAARVRAERWQRVYQGIYSETTGALTAPARHWAAILYCGPGATLSHETAASIHALAVRRDSRVHVTIPGQRHIPAPRGVALHRSSLLARSRHPVMDPPTTRVEATVVDLATAANSADRALAVVAQACQQRLTTSGRLMAEITSRRTLRWRRELLAALDDVAAGAHSLLELHYPARRGTAAPPAIGTAATPSAARRAPRVD